MKRFLRAIIATGIIGFNFVSPVSAYNLNEEGEYTVNFSYNFYAGERALCEEEGCGRALTLDQQVKSLRLDINEGDIVEIGSLLTDVGIARGETELPTDYSTNGEYHWKKAGGEDVAIETISRADFNEDKTLELSAAFNGRRAGGTEEYVVRVDSAGATDADGVAIMGEDLVFKKKDFSGYTLPVLVHDSWTFKGWSKPNADGVFEEFDGVISAESFSAESDFLIVKAIWESEEGEGVPGLVDETTGTEISFNTPVPVGSKLTVAGLDGNKVLKEMDDLSMKQIYDITVVREESEVPVKNNEMTISIPLPAELSGYGYFQIAYILDGEVKEYLPATVVDGKLVFNTTHLSVYGIQAANKPFVAGVEGVGSPETGANMRKLEEVGLSKATMILGGGAITTILGVLLILKRDKRTNF